VWMGLVQIELQTLRWAGPLSGPIRRHRRRRFGTASGAVRGGR
jgi:hypothetical protein